LSVGNPLFDSKTFPDLANLRSAAEEAKAITDYYESPGPIIGASATKRRVMSEMEESDVIHLATHAVADEWYPLRSKILLAKDASGAWGKDSDGVLEAYEIYKLNLARAKLVVLSACQTGVEKYYGGEGMIGLSRPFIAKRIPLVVASLWPVASDATARLMINFHRIRKTGGQPTAEALRQAQVEMIEDAESDNRLPYTWASFVAIGGYASF
jgi:CHAT domain-containing protein